MICKECCLLCVTARPTPWFPASLIVTRYLLHASPHCPPPIAQLRSCIQRLLQDDVNPKLEDLECLCKLLSTIGQQLERGGVVKGSAGMTQAQLAQRQKDKAMEGKKLMDAYFARIQRLVDNKALDSRLRFMLMDIQEQRSRGWAVRRKAEGPMKIEVPLLGGRGRGGVRQQAACRRSCRPGRPCRHTCCLAGCTCDPCCVCPFTALHRKHP